MRPSTLRQLGNLLALTGLVIMVLSILYVLPFIASTIGWGGIGTFVHVGYSPTQFVAFGQYMLSGPGFDLYFVGLFLALVWAKIGLAALMTGINIVEDVRELLGEQKPKSKLTDLFPQFIRPNLH